MKLFTIIKYQLYLLQLENYELGRYWRLLWQKGFWPKANQRKDLAWTLKAAVIFFVALLLHLAILLVPIAVASSKYQVAGALLFLILVPCYMLLYTAASLLIYPFDYWAKTIIVARARQRIKSLANLKIIGIAGSYGKTTMKEVVRQVVSSKYQAASTPESVNTPLGIARWILTKLDRTIDIAIVEMGEHYRGDVEELCKMTPPDIAMVTGINQAHLERMKSLDNIVSTVFEIASGTKPGGLVVLNGDDENVLKNYKKFVWPDHMVKEYQIAASKQQGFDVGSLAWEAELPEVGNVNINLLGRYALGDVQAAAIVAQHLGMNAEEIRNGIAKIQPLAHRLQPLRSAGDILVIDDSYNGNPAGAREATEVLGRFTGRRKIYLTPGLVETGKSSGEIHRQIGRDLAKIADVVILVKNSVTPFIAEGLGMGNQRISKSADQQISGSVKPQVIWFDSAPEAHAALPKILQPGDVIVFQNDWGDQYV